MHLNVLLKMNYFIILTFFLCSPSLLTAGEDPASMKLEQLEQLITPRKGMQKEKVELLFGYPSGKSGINGDETTKVTEYSLFYPVFMEVLYIDGKVFKSGIHHKVNLTDWSSDTLFDIAKAKHQKPKELNEWLKNGYLQFIKGRELLNGVEFANWRKPLNGSPK